jgi:hypothetical protein
LTDYFQSGMVDHDPVLGALDREAGAFTRTGAGAKVAAEGWTDGLVIPLRRTDSHYGLVGLVVNEHYLDKHQKTDLTGVSLVFHDRMRHHVPRDGFPLPPAAAVICSRCGFYETDAADAEATYDLQGGKDTLSIQGITKPVTFDGTHIFIDGQDAGTVTGYELLKF